MFKVSSYALALAVLTRTRTASAVCDGVIASLSDVECNYDNFVANLSGDCDIDVLFPTDETTTLTVEERVDALCRWDAPVQFVEIQGSHQKDRRFFKGGGNLVDGHKDEWSVYTGPIKRFEENASAKKLVGFPEYLSRVQYNINTGRGDNGYPANMNLDTSCALNTVMCCFIDDAKFDTFATNGDTTTDVCRHEHHDSPESNHIERGWSVMPGGETTTHCVGFTWKDEEEHLLGNMMYDVSLRQSLNKGYLKGIPGAPLCGCVEHMPVVEQADCRTASATGIMYEFSYNATASPSVTADNTATVAYSDCADGNDLAGQYKANNADDDGIDAHLVGDGGCDKDLETYFNEEEFLRAEPDLSSTRYVIPDPAVWGDLFVGEGVFYLPPAPLDSGKFVAEDLAETDAEFRALVEAPCTNADGSVRYCMIRRVCPSCILPSHQDIIYKRLTALPPPGTDAAQGQVNFLDMFLDRFVSSAPNNVKGTDYEIYSGYDDALAGRNEWKFCRFPHTVGFPHNCGPLVEVGNHWNSYTIHGHGYANHHGYFVERPATV